MSFSPPTTVDTSVLCAAKQLMKLAQQVVDETVSVAIVDISTTSTTLLPFDYTDEQRKTFRLLSRVGGKDSLSNTLKVLLLTVAFPAVHGGKSWTPSLVVRGDGTFTFPRFFEYKKSKKGDVKMYPSSGSSTVERYLAQPGNEGLSKALKEGDCVGGRSGRTNVKFFQALSERFSVSIYTLSLAWKILSGPSVSPESRTILLICALNRSVARLGDDLWHFFRTLPVDTQCKFLTDARAVVHVSCAASFRAAFVKLTHMCDTKFSRKKKQRILDLFPFFQYLNGGPKPACVFGASVSTEASSLRVPRPSKRVRTS